MEVIGFFCATAVATAAFCVIFFFGSPIGIVLLVASVAVLFIILAATIPFLCFVFIGKKIGIAESFWYACLSGSTIALVLDLLYTAFVGSLWNVGGVSHPRIFPFWRNYAFASPGLCLCGLLGGVTYWLVGWYGRTSK